MLPNMHDGDRLITTNFLYTPDKGDVVVVDKNTNYGKPLIKRVIATEGDKIFINIMSFCNNSINNSNNIFGSS